MMAGYFLEPLLTRLLSILSVLGIFMPLLSITVTGLVREVLKIFLLDFGVYVLKACYNERRRVRRLLKRFLLRWNYFQYF